MRRFLLCWIAVACSAVLAQYSVVPSALTSAVGPSSNGAFAGSPIQTSLIGRVFQIQFPAAQFAALPQGAKVTGIAFRLKNVPGAPTSWPATPINFSTFDVTIGSASNSISSMSTTFASNYFTFSFPGIGSVSSGVLSKSGPFQIPAGSYSTGATPNDFGIEIPIVPYQIQSGTDIVLTIHYRTTASLPVSGVELDAFNTGPNGASMAAGYGQIGSLPPTVPTTGSPSTVPIVRFTIQTEYQRNQPSLSLTHDGIQSDGTNPAIIRSCTNGTIFVEQTSTRLGFPGDIIVTSAPLVPRSHPASTQLLDGQVLNVQLQHPGTTFLFGGGPVPGMPPLFPFAFAFQAPATPVSWCSQSFVFDPSSASLFSLSQANQIEVSNITNGTLPGPTVDDTSVAITLGQSGLCGFQSFTFYGTAHTQIHVSANGRITFGTANASLTPTLAAVTSGPPAFGFWTDLDLGSFNSVNIQGAPTSLQVSYTGVRYASESAPFSFSLTLQANGGLGISGFGALPQNPLANAGPAGGDAQLLGISRGVIGGPVTNAFFPFGVNVNGAPGASLVDFWNGQAATRPNGFGLVRTIQENQLNFGLGRLDFTPAGAGYTALNH